jgi:isopropylmalate/homocitrate/citramalate synthase
MIEESVRYVTSQGRRVFYDCEHFFDGFRANREYALKHWPLLLKAALKCWCCAIPTAAACRIGCRNASTSCNAN